MLKRVLIANRGEIARRIARTCRRLDVEYVCVASEADANAAHLEGAVRHFVLGPAAAAESYLRHDLIVAAALESGCDAIHPGYGFLSENPVFAQAAVDAGLIFVGPAPETIAAMGDKSTAKQLMQQSGVPTVPGGELASDDPGILQAQAAAIGFPVILKPVTGGGGKGMTVVANHSEMKAAVESAVRLALANFGDGRLLVERFIARPRHIEVQVFGDAFGNVVHMFERECSLQRRYQKVIEEAPAGNLKPDTRQALLEAAVQGARSIGYRNAGTWEFIVEDDDSFYFMEANTRLQVEHPVTEEITGLDLVEWQLRIAAGEPLPMRQEQIRSIGHAVEGRVYAEDPSNEFRPAPGQARAIIWPRDVRVESAFDRQGAVSPFYDPLVAKLIAHAPDRRSAFKRLAAAALETEVVGLTTNLGFLARLAGHPRVIGASTDTHFIDSSLPELIDAQAPEKAAAVAAAIECANSRTASASPWAGNLGGPVERGFLDPEAPLGRFSTERDHAPIEARIVEAREGEFLIRVGDDDFLVSAMRTENGWRGEINRTGRWHAAAAGDILDIVVDGARVATRAFASASHGIDPSAGAVAPMPGVVVALPFAVGDKVAKGAVLAVVEAMKMENQVRSPFAGVVSEIRCNLGDQVPGGQLLVLVDPHDGDGA